MSSMRSYGKLNPLDQANLEARRKTRRRLTIIGISTSALVTIIVISVLAVNRNDSSDDSNSDDNNINASPFSTSIKAMSDATLYPNSCVDSLSSVANSTGLDPVKLFNLTLQVAINGLTKVSDYFRDLRTNDTMSSLAVANCNELIELAIDHINDCVTSPIGFQQRRAHRRHQDVAKLSNYKPANLHRWIQQLDRVNQDPTELASYSLAIFTNLHNLFGSFKLRRLLSNEYNPTPSWLSTQEWRLLQRSSDPRWDADIVVAKDGTGKYKTIKAALKAVPEKSKKRTVIYVKKGMYYENVRVQKKKWNVLIVGDGKNMTVASGRLNVLDGTPTFSTATFGETNFFLY